MCVWHLGEHYIDLRYCRLIDAEVGLLSSLRWSPTYPLYPRVLLWSQRLWYGLHRTCGIWSWIPASLTSFIDEMYFHLRVHESLRVDNNNNRTLNSRNSSWKCLYYILPGTFNLLTVKRREKHWNFLFLLLVFVFLFALQCSWTFVSNYVSCISTAWRCRLTRGWGVPSLRGTISTII